MSTDPSRFLQCVRLSPFAILPTRGSESAVGFDLYSAYSITVEPSSHAVVLTDLSFKFPLGCYGRIAPRSGLAIKHMIDVGGGVIDPDYRGNVGIVLFNFGKSPFYISRGDRVAQMICEKAEFPELQLVSSLDCTNRGDSGFGSTGV